uniref:ATP-grasp domain-containing protein n=1 Tax=Pseudictyota dubia TaxID=2749911 RepID=A0A7R9ZID5_9STRA|mmetsp:Transcript_898/g.1426  ORF Transcript_898/g.1426 Transcript_898/m.1426 type:complete len:547 (+) Transcript_898:78-1718(+)
MSPIHCEHPVFEPTTEPIELSGAPVPHEDKGGNAEHLLEHEALVGDELKSEKLIEKQPTLAALGETPFVDDGEEVEYHKIVATEIVADPVAVHEPEPILQNSIILLEPRIAECLALLESAKKRGLFVTVVNTRVFDGSMNIMYYPTAEKLLEVGVHQVYEPPTGQKFSVTECANHLHTIQSQQNLRFLGVLPLREAMVEHSDILSALLGLAVHNDLGTSSARRDKALMKQTVANAGLRVAKYARLTARDGSDVRKAVEELELEFPVVVKTPRGMSTCDVYICETMEEAIERSGQIVRSVGPDGTKANFSLLEEFLGGTEFAVNLIACPTTYRGVQVTDIWQYDKIITDGSNVNRWQTMVDPHDPKYAAMVRYAEGVCRAVGIRYGLGHCEIKAKWDEKRQRWVDPAMIEIGARLAGGRKAIMASKTIPGWYPFDALLDAHCGFPLRVPPSFSPVKVARHVYVPSDKTGILRSYTGADFQRLSTYDDHIMFCEVGKPIKRAVELMSFAGQVWLIGTLEQVEKDAEAARNDFNVEVDPLPVENGGAHR